MSSPGLILSITSCVTPLRPQMQDWLTAFGAETLARSGTSGLRVLVEADLPDYRRPATGVSTWMSCVDVDQAELPVVFDELRAHEKSDEEARRMLGLALRRENRSYRPLDVTDVARAGDASRIGEVMHFWWDTDDGGEAALADWYDGEHIPILMRVPGWLRIRRYELVRGGGPRFLAVHDIESPSVTQSGHPALAEAGATRWRERILEQRQQYEFSRFVVPEVAEGVFG